MNLVTVSFFNDNRHEEFGKMEKFKKKHYNNKPWKNQNVTDTLLGTDGTDIKESRYQIHTHCASVIASYEGSKQC